jgi:CheY-like chemotaxis protein
MTSTGRAPVRHRDASLTGRAKVISAAMWRRLCRSVIDWYRPQTGPVIGLDERVRYVRVAISIGLVVGFLFSLFNLMTEGMLALGSTELAVVLFLLIPAAFVSRVPAWVAVSERLVILASMVIFGALIVLGGIEGTGIFWVFTVPFLAFFLKDQKRAWLCSFGFWVVAAIYLTWVSPLVAFAHHYSPVVKTHFLLSFAFYVLVAAAFNHIRTRYESQLRRGKLQAEAAVRAKSRFLAAASHDLRQPAHALGLFVARLSQLPHDAATQALVSGVDASVRGLQQMLDYFFDYSRLDTPSMKITASAFPIEGVFEQLRIGFASQAAAKGLRMHIRDSPVWVQSDPGVLHRVLLNLVSNALQYTHEGGVLVACRPARDPRFVRIEVWDSGIGIAPEHHEVVFSEFFQVENPERDRSKGIGLGLSIVDRSCRLLNHPLVMRSQPGVGTRFSLRLPVAGVRPPAGAPLLADVLAAEELTGLQVLVVEDDVLSGAALEGLLVTWGCKVRLVRDAHLACLLVQQGSRPDFVISDYRLPGAHHGIDAIRLLRQMVGGDLSACLVSGDMDERVKQDAAESGLVLLQKPVRPAKLRSVLRHFVQSRVGESGGLDLS